MGALVRSCHPEPTAAVTLLVTALPPPRAATSLGVVLVAAAVLTGQLSIGWLNDALDADRDVRGRPRRQARGRRRDVGATVRTATVVAALASRAALAGVRSSSAGAVHLVAVAAGWAYDLGAQVDGGVGACPTWCASGCCPVFVVLGAARVADARRGGCRSAGALLGAGAHFANVLPDLDDDAATGVRGLPHRLGAQARRVGRGAAPAGRVRSCSPSGHRFRRSWPPRRRCWPRPCSRPGSARAAARLARAVPGRHGRRRCRVGLLVAAGPALVGLTRVVVGQATAARAAGRHGPAGQPQVDARVEDAAVRAAADDRGVDEPAVRPSRAIAPRGGGGGRAAAQRRPVPGARRRAVQRGRPRQHARQQRVVDALAGQRVDQAGGVADEQHPAVGLEARAGGQRQVVAAHGARLGLLARELPASALEELAAGCPRRGGRTPRSPRSPARRAAGTTTRRPGAARGRTRSPARRVRSCSGCSRGSRRPSSRGEAARRAADAPTEFAPSAPTTTRAAISPSTTTRSGRPHPPHAVPAQLRTAATAASTMAASNTVRGSPGAAGRSRAATAAAGRAHPQPRHSGRPTRRGRRRVRRAGPARARRRRRRRSCRGGRLRRPAAPPVRPGAPATPAARSRRPPGRTDDRDVGEPATPCPRCRLPRSAPPHVSRPRRRALRERAHHHRRERERRPGPVRCAPVVVGRGPTGRPVAAVLLAQHGVAATVVDRHTAPLPCHAPCTSTASRCASCSGSASTRSSRRSAGPPPDCACSTPVCARSPSSVATAVRAERSPEANLFDQPDLEGFCCAGSPGAPWASWTRGSAGHRRRRRPGHAPRRPHRAAGDAPPRRCSAATAHTAPSRDAHRRRVARPALRRAVAVVDARCRAAARPGAASTRCAPRARGDVPAHHRRPLPLRVPA